MVSPVNKKRQGLRSRSQLKQVGPGAEQRRSLAVSYKLTLAAVGVLDSLRHRRAGSDAPAAKAQMAHALHPQLQKKTLENVYRVNKSRSLKQILDAKLRTQQQKITDLKVREEQRQKEIALARDREKRERERATRRAERERKQELELERSWRQRSEERLRSESSFLSETRRDSIGMLRRARDLQSRGQRSMADERLRETARSSRIDQERRSLQKAREHYEKDYRKAFLKNSPPPRQSLPDAVLYSTLRQRAEKITEAYVLPQHLPKLTRNSSRLSQPADKLGQLEQELMICSMKPKDPKSRKPKQTPTPTPTPTPNPEVSSPPLEAKPPTPSPTPEPVQPVPSAPEEVVASPPEAEAVGVDAPLAGQIQLAH